MASEVQKETLKNFEHRLNGLISPVGKEEVGKRNN